MLSPTSIKNCPLKTDSVEYLTCQKIFIPVLVIPVHSKLIFFISFYFLKTFLRWLSGRKNEMMKIVRWELSPAF